MASRVSVPEAFFDRGTGFPGLAGGRTHADVDVL